MAKADATSAIARLAEQHADVVRGVACAGTSVESTTFNVGGKAFLFVRAGVGELRLKRASGWVKVSFADGTLPRELDAWIAESYALVAGGKRATKKPEKPKK